MCSTQTWGLCGLWREVKFGLTIACPIERKFQSAMCVSKHRLGYNEAKSKVVSVCYGSSPRKFLRSIDFGSSLRW